MHPHTCRLPSKDSTTTCSASLFLFGGSGSVGRSFCLPLSSGGCPSVAEQATTEVHAGRRTASVLFYKPRHWQLYNRYPVSGLANHTDRHPSSRARHLCGRLGSLGLTNGYRTWHTFTQISGKQPSKAIPERPAEIRSQAGLLFVARNAEKINRIMW